MAKRRKEPTKTGKKAEGEKLAAPAPPPVLSQHERQCTVCNHPDRQEIEREYCAWKSPDDIAETHKISRDALFRHVNAIPKLKDKRSRNIRSALETIIERGSNVEVTAAAVVSAVQAYTKINKAGQWVDKHEVSASIFSEDMTPKELETYARTGKLPERLAGHLDATEEQPEETVTDA